MSCKLIGAPGHQVLVGPVDVGAKTGSQEAPVLTNLGIHIVALLVLDLHLQDLSHPFYGVQVEEDVFLAPELPLLADHGPGAQGSTKDFTDSGIVGLPSLDPAGAGPVFLAFLLVN